MTPQQTAILAFVAAQPSGTADAAALAAFNTTSTVDVLVAAVAEKAKSLGVPARWLTALASGQATGALAANLQLVLAMLSPVGYSTINPASPLFAALVGPIQTAGLLSADELAQLAAMATTSPALQAGFAAPAVQGDLDGARQAQSNETLLGAMNAAYTAVVQPVPLPADVAAADALREQRIKKQNAFLATSQPLPQFADASAALAWVDALPVPA